MKRRLLVLGLAVWAAVFLALATAVFAGSQPALPAPLSDPAEMIPSLSAADADRAGKLALAKVESLLGRLPVRLTDIGVWHTGTDYRVIGAVVEFSIDTPESLTAQWPTMNYDETESSTLLYTKDFAHYAATGVTKLVAFVDLGRGEVVQLTPGPGAVVTNEIDAPRLRSVPTGK